MAKDKSRFLLKLTNRPNFSVYVYINAWYMLIPWETIFKIYRPGCDCHQLVLTTSQAEKWLTAKLKSPSTVVFKMYDQWIKE